jgi:hypothetical protein
MPAMQYWFTGGALAALLALITAAGTLGYGWYRAAVTEMEAASAKVASAEERRKTEKLKELFGKYLVTGGAILRGLQTQEDTLAAHQAAHQAANEWAQKIHDLILGAYGEGEAVLFTNSSGYVFYGDGSEKSKLRNGIDGRLRRLSELPKRTDVLVPRKDFDPKMFD